MADNNKLKFKLYIMKKINSLLQEGLIPISLSYFGNFITGNYMIADNKGFFSIIKKR